MSKLTIVLTILFAGGVIYLGYVLASQSSGDGAPSAMNVQPDISQTDVGSLPNHQQEAHFRVSKDCALSFKF